mgnify:CR=1 FL=1
MADDNTMAIANVASSLSQSQLATDVSMAVQRKTLSAAKQQGEAMVALIEQASNVGKAGSSDALSAAATGKGGQVDVYA